MRSNLGMAIQSCQDIIQEDIKGGRGVGVGESEMIGWKLMLKEGYNERGRVV